VILAFNVDAVRLLVPAKPRLPRAPPLHSLPGRSLEYSFITSQELKNYISTILENRSRQIYDTWKQYRAVERAMSLCFEDSFKAFKGHKIAEEEYLHYLIAHFRGERHSGDTDTRNFKFILRKFNPYAEAIRYTALETDYPTFDQSAPLEALFKSCLNNQKDDVTTIVQRLDEMGQFHPLCQPLATLAAEKGHAHILEICLDKGANFEPVLERAVELGFDKSPDMLSILSARKWRNIQDANGDKEQVNYIVRPWLKPKDQGTKDDECKAGTHKSRHERLVKSGKHPHGTCWTPEELEEKFGDIGW